MKNVNKLFLTLLLTAITSSALHALPQGLREQIAQSTNTKPALMSSKICGLLATTCLAKTAYNALTGKFGALDVLATLWEIGIIMQIDIEGGMFER